MLALGDGTTLLLNLKEGAVGVFAGRGAMALDTCFAGVFFIADENHCVVKWRELERKQRTRSPGTKVRDDFVR